jgi:hypothetical protein
VGKTSTDGVFYVNGLQLLDNTASAITAGSNHDLRLNGWSQGSGDVIKLSNNVKIP